MLLLIFKAFHIIFTVVWFAALLYIPRLFRFQAEALDKPEPDRSVLIGQYKLMSRQLWIFIGWPSAILSIIFGLGIMSPYFNSLWFWVKMVLVFGLCVFHLFLHYNYIQLRNDRYKYSARQYRSLGEFSGIFLVAIVFLAVLKNAINYVLLGITVVALVLLTILGLSAYMRRRKAHRPDSN
jgi:protoporphyrinogen IX oxidase